MSAPVERRLPVDRQYPSFYEEADRADRWVLLLAVCAVALFCGCVWLLLDALKT